MDCWLNIMDDFVAAGDFITTNFFPLTTCLFGCFSPIEVFEPRLDNDIILTRAGEQ
jgi:hypothetical protein